MESKKKPSRCETVALLLLAQKPIMNRAYPQVIDPDWAVLLWRNINERQSELPSYYWRTARDEEMALRHILKDKSARLWRCLYDSGFVAVYPGDDYGMPIIDGLIPEWQHVMQMQSVGFVQPHEIICHSYLNDGRTII